MNNNFNNNAAAQHCTFDYAPSVFPPRKGEPALSLPCTKQIFDSMVDSPAVAQTIDRIEKIQSNITTELTDDEFKAALKSNKDAVNAEKKRLPVLMPCAHSLTSLRKITGSDSYVESHVDVLDIDGVRYPDLLYKNQIAPKVERLHILIAHKTPSLFGEKVYFLRPKNLSKIMAMKWLAHELGIESYDTSVKDPLRAHYLVPRSFIQYCNDELFDPNLTNEGYTVQLPTELLLDAIDESDEATAITPVPDEAATHEAATPVEAEQPFTVEANEELTYHGIPYHKIIEEYWKQNGGEPCKGDRNTRIYELVRDLRHITGFDAKLLDTIVPNYDGFPEAEKLQVIESALKASRYSMPLRMQNVLQTFKAASAATNPELVQVIDEFEEQNNSAYYTSLEECFTTRGKKVPGWIRAFCDGVPSTIHMSLLLSSTPFIGGIATEVKLAVHNEVGHLNIIAFQVGEAASGKSHLDKLYRQLCHKLIEETDINLKMLEDWKSLPKKEREKVRRPAIHVRIQPLRTSIANVLENLNNSEGKHLISFSAEGDQLTQNNRSGAFANVSVLIRISFDGSEYRSGYSGESAVNANLKEVLWNMSMSMTPDALYRAITNVTDGELTRICITHLPDNTFAPLVTLKPRSKANEHLIREIAVLLEQMRGEIELPELEERSQQWVEAIRLETLQNGDRVKARLRMRVAVCAMRIVCCMMLCGLAEWLLLQFEMRKSGKPLPKWGDGANTAEQYLATHPDATQRLLTKHFEKPEYLDCYNIVADYLMENTLYYFRHKIQRAYDNGDKPIANRRRQGKNDTVFSRLAQEFTIEDLRREKSVEKGSPATEDEVKQMVKNWKHQGLIDATAPGKYHKL